MAISTHTQLGVSIKSFEENSEIPPCSYEPSEQTQSSKTLVMAAQPLPKKQGYMTESMAVGVVLVAKRWVLLGLFSRQRRWHHPKLP